MSTQSLHVTASYEPATGGRYTGWYIRYDNPCLNCGKRHRHGAGYGEKPTIGSGHWLPHCPDNHRRFRDDCVMDGNGRCSIKHAPHSGVDIEVKPLDD